MTNMRSEDCPRQVVVDLCRRLYELGWATGTGGGISIREGERVFVAPSGVQKECILVGDVFELGIDGSVLSTASEPSLRPSECTPLFMNAFRLRDAGAVLHSHGMFAMLASLSPGTTFECAEFEMIKGIRGHGYHDRLVVPIIENTAHERDLADSMAQAMEEFPRSHAVLVRRHGVYIWGDSWQKAKIHAECYHYLFEAVVRTRHMGL